MKRDKKGVVKDPAIHKGVIEKVLAVARDLHFIAAGLDFSPIKGPEGNIEYLLYLGKTGKDTVDEKKIEEVVELSHSTL